MKRTLFFRNKKVQQSFRQIIKREEQMLLKVNVLQIT